MPEKSTAVPAPADKAEAAKTGGKDHWRYDKPILLWSLLDDAGFTKAQIRIIAHLARRGQSYSKARTMAMITRTHPVYLRLVLSELVKMGLVMKRERKGRTNIYWLAPMHVWRRVLAKRTGEPMIGPMDGTVEGYEDEKSLEAEIKLEFWDQLFVSLTDDEVRWFTKLSREDPEKFGRVMNDTRDRQREGALGHQEKLKDACKYFTDTWKRFK
jgi:hypothetical protein